MFHSVITFSPLIYDFYHDPIFQMIYRCYMDATNPTAWKMGSVFGLVHTAFSLAIFIIYGTLVGFVWRSSLQLRKFGEGERSTKTQVTELPQASSSLGDNEKTCETEVDPSTQTQSAVESEVTSDAITRDDSTNNGAKPQRVVASSHSKIHSSRHTRLLKVSSLFVLAYLTQWWPSIVFYGMTPFSNDLGNWYVLSLSIFANSGGLCNMMAYSLIRNIIIKN